VTCASSAKKWLSGTFLYVRLKENPGHYKIDGNVPSRNLDESLETFIQKAIASLQQHNLVGGTMKLRCTEFGDAMARYYLQFDTMKVFLDLAPKAKISEILSAISNAAEFKNIRFRAGEKNMYKNLNKNGSIKFPIPSDLSLPAHKVSLIIQAVLGAIDLPTEDQKQQWEFQTSKATIFQHVRRLVHCIIDCQLYLEDSIATRNALMLARSLGAQVWDDSPLHMKQLEGVGIISVRKLVAVGISSVECLETAEPHRIEQALARNPPYGLQMQGKAKAFPKLRISVRMVGEPQIKKGVHVNVKIKAEIGFLNEKIPEMFQRRAVYVCLLAETSDGHKVHFVRISAKKLNKGQDVLFSANLTSPSQSIRAYVTCDEIAGTMRHVVLNPQVPAIHFPPQSATEDTEIANAPTTPTTNLKKHRASQTTAQRDSLDSTEFDDGGLDDADLASIAVDEFVNISDFEDDGERSRQPPKKRQKTMPKTAVSDDWEPKQLSNGKWACNHACKDKSSCKHLCCREGVDKKPKPPKQKESKKDADARFDSKQTQLSMSTTKKSGSIAQSKTSVTKPEPKPQIQTVTSKEILNQNRLHERVPTKMNNVPRLGPGWDDTGRRMPASTLSNQSFLDKTRNPAESESSEYGKNVFDSNDLPEMDAFMGAQPASHMSRPRNDEHSLFDFGFFDNMEAVSEVTDAPKYEDFGSNEYEDKLYERGSSFGKPVNESIAKPTNASKSSAASESKKYSGAGSNRTKPLFTSYSTSDNYSSELPAAVNPTQDDREEAKLTSTFFEGAQNVRSGKERSFNDPIEPARNFTSERSAVATASKDYIASSVEHVDEDAKSDDSVVRLVKGLLGTKDFNYID
jgi:ATP-dependent DNA helicase HFM1/MER3